MSLSEKNEILWRQYDLHVGLYKHYLDLALKLNIFFYATTGAILSFYFANRPAGGPLLRWALALPFAMSLGLGILFFWAATRVDSVRQELERVVVHLELKVLPEVHVLTVVLVIFGALSAITAAGLVIVVCTAPH